MHRIAKSVLLVLFAVMCVGALSAASASAGVLPLFLTASGTELLFTADSGAGTLRGQGGAEVKCEQDLAHGFVLDKSSLAHEVEVSFHKNCEQKIGLVKSKCTEPIKTKLLFGELGLLHEHVLILFAPEAGSVFVTLTCGGNSTTVEGAVIGEIKLLGADGGSQYGVLRKDFLLLFNANGTKQEPKEIELLDNLMQGVSLQTKGFFAGEASEETHELVLPDGNVQIDP